MMFIAVILIGIGITTMKVGFSEHSIETGT